MRERNRQSEADELEARAKAIRAKLEKSSSSPEFDLFGVSRVARRSLLSGSGILFAWPLGYFRGTMDSLFNRSVEKLVEKAAEAWLKVRNLNAF